MGLITHTAPTTTSLDTIVNRVCERLSIQPEELRQPTKRSTLDYRFAKQMVTWLAKQYTTATNREIMEALGLRDDKSLHTNIKTVDETLMQYGRRIFASQNRETLLVTIREDRFCSVLMAINTELTRGGKPIDSIEKKLCGKCKKAKNADEFTEFKGGSYLQSYCKGCRSEYDKDRYANKEQKQVA